MYSICTCTCTCNYFVGSCGPISPYPSHDLLYHFSFEIWAFKILVAEQFPTNTSICRNVYVHMLLHEFMYNGPSQIWTQRGYIHVHVCTWSWSTCTCTVVFRRSCPALPCPMTKYTCIFKQGRHCIHHVDLAYSRSSHMPSWTLCFLFYNLLQFSNQNITSIHEVQSYWD